MVKKKKKKKKKKERLQYRHKSHQENWLILQRRHSLEGWYFLGSSDILLFWDCSPISHCIRKLRTKQKQNVDIYIWKENKRLVCKWARQRNERREKDENECKVRRGLLRGENRTQYTIHNCFQLYCHCRNRCHCHRRHLHVRCSCTLRQWLFKRLRGGEVERERKKKRATNADSVIGGITKGSTSRETKPIVQ